MAKIIINDCELHCYINKKLSKYNDTYYDIEQRYFGDKFHLHSENTMLRVKYNEESNTATLIIGHYDYINEKFYPLLEYCNSYNDVVNFGNIVWHEWNIMEV